MGVRLPTHSILCGEDTSLIPEAARIFITISATYALNISLPLRCTVCIVIFHQSLELHRLFIQSSPPFAYVFSHPLCYTLCRGNSPVAPTAVWVWDVAQTTWLPAWATRSAARTRACAGGGLGTVRTPRILLSSPPCCSSVWPAQSRPQILSHPGIPGEVKGKIVVEMINPTWVFLLLKHGN